jgi:acyl CoA:acetate/3-ketoacid CoA transferase
VNAVRVSLDHANFRYGDQLPAVIDHVCAFESIDGGGLDAAFFGIRACGAQGNVNASKFGRRIPALQARERARKAGGLVRTR